LHIGCRSLDALIRMAYIRFAKAVAALPVLERQMRETIEGEPGWATSQLFTIDAKPESPQPTEMMRGPMLQGLLEERFRLKIRHESRDVPVYALVVGKGGPKLEGAKPGTCTPEDKLDPTVGPVPGQPPFCGFFHPGPKGGVETLGQTIENLCRQFSVAVDRDVVDRTGVAGKYDIRLDMTFDELFPFAVIHGDAASDAGPAAPPSTPLDPLGAITAAVQKLGLRLEPSKAAADFLAIEHVERPSEN
jgi:uncharacterized protein (TIGR03435 family)